MEKVRLVIRRFKASKVKAGPVHVGVLRLVNIEKREESLEKGRDAIELALEHVEHGPEPYSFVEVIIEVGGARLVIGEGEGSGDRRLSFRPERLLRVGVVRRKALKPVSDVEEYQAPGVSAFHFKLDDVEWYKVRGNVYVYEGYVELGDGAGDVVLVILETETGRRYLRPSAFSTHQKSS